MSNARQHMSLAEFARLHQVGLTYVRAEIKQGRLRAYRLGDSLTSPWRITDKDADAWLETRMDRSGAARG